MKHDKIKDVTTAPPSNFGAPQRPPLLRATAQSAQMPSPWLAGVASGVSVHLGIPVGVVRSLFAVAGIYGGAGLLIYALLAGFVPRDDASAQSTERGAAPLNHVDDNRQALLNARRLLLAGIGIISFSALFILSNESENGIAHTALATTFVIAGLWAAWSQASNLNQWRSFKFWGIVILGMFLVVIGASIYLSQELDTVEVLRGVIYGAALVIVFLLILLPLWLKAAGQLSHSQERAVRETERANIAAHLHDSVLQTLTLIRAAADNPAKVRALALRQESELRSWLYTGQSEAHISTAESLRETVVNTEATYGVAVDVVTVGDTPPGPNELAIVAAAGEAVTNAVRHGQPPVSVYMEIHPTSIDIFIKDRGTGFELDAIPHDRHGVRGSIIGRVERVGGKASIRCLESGTEVHLSVPLTMYTHPAY